VTVTGPVQRVVELLEREGYEIVEQPRSIGGIPFEFSAMLVGRSSLDLIALVDLAIESDDEPVRRRVEGLARALDLVRSRRSLTVILVGPRRGTGLIQGIADVARVLTVGSPGEDDDAELRDALAVLLPLVVTTENDEGEDSWPAVRDRMVAAQPAEAQGVLSAARSGKSAVEKALRAMLCEPIDDLFQAEDGHEKGEE
jgi:hypothetical protein